MQRVPGAQPVANAITKALDALEDIVSGRDTIGSQRLKEALISMMMQVTITLPTWWQDISDRDKKALGIPTQQDRIPKDRTDLVNIVNRIVQPNGAMKPPASSTPSDGSIHSPHPLRTKPPAETPNPSTGTTSDPSPTLAPVRQSISDQSGTIVSGSMNGTDIIIRRLKRLLSQYAVGLDQGISSTQSPHTLISELKRILKSQQAMASHSQDARHAEQLNRVFDQITDGIEDIGELESILKALKSMGPIPPLLMDTLKGAVADWLAQECDPLSPQHNQNLMDQVNTLAKQTIGQDLITNQDLVPSLPDSESQPPSVSFTPLSVPLSTIATPPYYPPNAPDSQRLQETNPDAPIKQATRLIEAITQCLTDYALQRAKDAFDPLLTTRASPDISAKPSDR